MSLISNFPVISSDQVEQVKWTGNSIIYDSQLYSLGSAQYNKFIVVNPEMEVELLSYITDVPNTRSCIIWCYRGTWVARLFPKNWNHTYGYSIIELSLPEMPNSFDVVFISYNEPNAEEHWNRVLDKAPNAKRVSNVSGILEAHIAAASQITTEMFYVVDGDAHLANDWEFNFQPSFINKNATHVWHSQNPINELTYGYGGVKLFPRDVFRNLENTKPLDITMSVSKRLMVIDQISNVTAFNTDPFSTWKSAVRECTKLLLKTDAESASRLAVWSADGIDRPFGEYAIAGAAYARQLVEQGTDPITVNDRDWLQQEFNKIYNERI